MQCTIYRSEHGSALPTAQGDLIFIWRVDVDETQPDRIDCAKFHFGDNLRLNVMVQKRRPKPFVI
jgi:hypothetical protein